MRTGLYRGLREKPSWWPGDLRTTRSLSALLDIRANEVLGVLLKDVIDLVEQIVGLLG